MVKGEKWACTTLEAGKNKPVIFIAGTRDFKRFSEEIESGISYDSRFLVRVFITDLILWHSAEMVETYSQSTEKACVYKEFCNTKGI